MRTFGQFLFDLFMDFYFALVSFYLVLHLIVLEDEDLGLLRLVLQLCGELVIL